MSQFIKLKTQDEPHDDRWHYLDFENNKNRKNYTEWKYFNFVQKDLSGYIIYYILDPEKGTNLSGGRLIVRILKDGVSYGLVKKIEIDQIELDAVSASMRMGNAKIIEKDSYHYELNCQDKDFSWTLNYKQKAPSIEAFQDVNPGFLIWEKMNWLIKMPRAEVKGDITIGEETFHIDGLGYSDTNWGEMMPFFSRYEWCQYNEKSFSLVFGVLYGLEKIKSTYLYLVIDKHLIRLENVETKVEHLEWKEDETIGVKIPIKNSFFIKNEEYEIKFVSKLLYHDSPGLKISSFLPKVIVSEQIVEYEGSVKKNGVLLHEFKGRGFQEWSGKTWKDIPLSF
ncbi:MAG: hypothetical protein WC884_00345 [Candidatus Paceibacterota bacterium]